ncbi:MAG: hypothetical protein U9Q40_11930 [Campylobacterota bacterium]|nr:hypothetical protein [Campylobacterota bacterium]
MSLKNDLDMVKEELNSEEKFFEKAVITEKFVKKYKNLMIASVVAIVVFVVGNIAYDVNNQNTKEAANAALLELIDDSANQGARARLESLSPALYDVWLYSQAVVNKDIATLESLKSSEATLVGDLASYELAVESKDASALDEYALKQESIYKDLAQVQSAVLLIQDGKAQEAHQKLSLITVDSPLAQVAASLMHYGVK